MRWKLSPLASLCDLMDLAEDAGPERFRAAIEAAGKAPQIDGVLAIYSPKMGGDAAAVARALAEVKRTMGKPLLSCWIRLPQILDSVFVLLISHTSRITRPRCASVVVTPVIYPLLPPCQW